MKQKIFVSSVQKEFAVERKAVRDFVRNDPVLRDFFDVFLFEDIPAGDRRADAVYLDQVDRCDVYVGLFGMEYGAEDREGLSPTEREFDRATEQHKTRLIFVKGTKDEKRHQKMLALIRKAGSQLVRRRFTVTEELKSALNASLVQRLREQGKIQSMPFDEQACPRAGLADINNEAVAKFLRRARNERHFPLADDASTVDILTHLHLLEDGLVSNAAILLFGRDPQKFLPCSEIRCMHFHGTEIRRPVPFYQIFKGNLFEQVDQAVDFVLSKVNRSVGTRAEGPRAPVRYELPEDVVAEAIVNAIVHRDYTSSAAVQVSVFSDRVEVWNPGELLPPLTAASLRAPHRSVLRNKRIAEPLYLTHYIEKYGTGTLMMIRESVEYALPEPRFGTEQPGEFGVTVWRDWLTEEVMAGLGLNGRQAKAVGDIKASVEMTSARYRELTGCIPRTATRDLDDLVSKGILQKVGGVGRGACYVLRRKPDINRTNQTLESPGESDINRTNRTSAAGGIGSREGTGSQQAHAVDPTRSGKQTRQKSIRGDTKIGKRDINGTNGTSTPSVAKRAKIGPNGPQTAMGRSSRKSADRPSRPTQLTDPVSRILAVLQHEALSPDAIRQAVGIKHRPTFRTNYLHPALKGGLIEPTVPDKPTSRLQKYRITDKGRAWLRKSRPTVLRGAKGKEA